jgi:chromosomal replication initiation ATPase DnaA
MRGADPDGPLQRALNAARAVGANREADLVKEMEAICEAADLTLEAVRGPERSAHLVEMRRILARFLKERGCSQPRSGRLLNREHTTVHHLLTTPQPQSRVVELPAER